MYNCLTLCAAAAFTYHTVTHREAGLDADMEESSVSAAVPATTVVSIATLHSDGRRQLGAGAFGVVWYVFVLYACVFVDIVIQVREKPLSLNVFCAYEY